MSNNYAYLKTESPFYDIFDQGIVPITNILIPDRVELDGSDETDVYMVDWEKCTDKQKQLLALRVTTLRDGVVAEFLNYMKNNGKLPLRVSQTLGVSTDSAFFL
jgi:hypothetical protein